MAQSILRAVQSVIVVLATVTTARFMGDGSQAELVAAAAAAICIVLLEYLSILLPKKSSWIRRILDSRSPFEGSWIQRVVRVTPS